MREARDDGEEVLVQEPLVLLEELLHFGESFLLDGDRVVTALDEQLGEGEVATGGRDVLGGCERLAGKGDGCWRVCE